MALFISPVVTILQRGLMLYNRLFNVNKHRPDTPKVAQVGGAS